MDIPTIPAKTIVSGYSDNNRWFGINFNMNIYKGCSHGCIYCDSRSDCYRVDNFDMVRAKENALTIIEHDLKTKRKRGIVGTGAMSDPYNPFEETKKLTRGALKLIDKYGFGISLTTKSEMAVRDIDLLQKINEHSPTVAMFTITTIDDTLCRKIEQNVATTSNRLSAIKKISDAGITTGVLLMPILPFINDTEENILGIVQAAHESGAKFIYPAFGVTLRANQRDYFYQKLDALFPNTKQKYINQFGNTYSCSSPNAKALTNVFTSQCKKLGLTYKMTEIIALVRRGYEDCQMSFF